MRDLLMTSASLDLVGVRLDFFQVPCFAGSHFAGPLYYLQNTALGANALHTG